MSLLHWMMRASPLLPLAALPLLAAGTAGRPVLSAVRAAPSLTSPARAAVIAQNGPATGCAPQGMTSFVHRLDFEWSPVARAVRYELIIEGEGEHATGPVFFHSVVADTRARYTKCHTKLLDMNRYRWQWRVRGLDARFLPGPWSAPGKLRYD
jgi:hypothetical protein